MIIRLFFFLSPKYIFFLSQGYSAFMCLDFLHSKQMISLLSSLLLFLNLESLCLEECQNYPFFFIICQNFLDMKATSSSLDPSKLSGLVDSHICNSKALNKFLLSSLLKLFSLDLEQCNSSFVDAPNSESELHRLLEYQETHHMHDFSKISCFLGGCGL